ncbi:integrase core domain-containing protein [Nioella ostreopsis]|uniref:integrase core domain-containing protein n=1 Tax=Nioella ostreopsis TaxID=2448479 RepID=UPI003B83A3C5
MVCQPLTRIPPAKPQQNARVERNNRTIGQERLDLRICETIDELQQIATEWLCICNKYCVTIALTMNTS